jgi:hypothetical protein
MPYIVKSPPTVLKMYRTHLLQFHEKSKIKDVLGRIIRVCVEFRRTCIYFEKISRHISQI